jgi:ABC-2 type transport system permease protein
VNFQKQAIASAQAEEQERLDSIRKDIPKIVDGSLKVSPFQDPRMPATVGRSTGVRYAILPPAPLAALAIGQSDLYPYYFKVTTGSSQTFMTNDEIEHPVHLLAGRFDLAFVVLFLYPLVILAFSYNLISGEKESGTLALMLSQPVSLGKLVLAKILLRAGFLIVLSIVLGLVGIAIGGADFQVPGALTRLLFWILITSAYGAFWFALAVAVNAFGKSSAANAIVLAGLWLLFVVVTPSLLNIVVEAAHPAPSRVEMIQAIRTAGDTASRQGSQLLARYLEDHPELAPPQEAGKGGPPDFATLQVAVSDATDRSVKPVLDQFEGQIAAQQNLVDRLRYLSPAIVAQSALNDIAGSGAQRYGHFTSQVNAFHVKWREYFFPRTLKKEMFTVDDVAGIPAFVYREESIESLAGRLAGSVAGLLVPVVVVALFSFLALRRFTVVN